MNMKRNLIGALAFCAAVSAPLASFALPVVHTTQASFLAATSNTVTDTYNDLTGALQASPMARAPGGGYTYNVNIANGIFAAGTPADRWLAGNTATDSIILNTFAGGVFAVGGFFFTTDIGGASLSGDVTVETSDGGVTSMSLLGTAPTSFLGFTSASQIVSVTITADNTGATPGNFRWPTVNDLILGGEPTTQPPPNPAPEPGTLPLIALAAVALVASARRRKSH